MKEEIERKYLVESLPKDLDQFNHESILQGYIAISSDGTEVRLRKKSGKHFLTVKSCGDAVRKETEIEIAEKQFGLLWPTTEERRLEKTRYIVPFGEKRIELDIYGGALAGLVTAEVEFDSLETSGQFAPPEWLGKEVTGDRRYKNQSLALYGAPKNNAP